MLINTPTTYKKIVPEYGCGFILKRIADLTVNPKAKHPTKQDVYAGTQWANRPGFGSTSWGAMVVDGLIASDDGMAKYEPFKGFRYSDGSTYTDKRTGGHYEPGRGYTVRYHLTDKGRRIFREMMERVTENYMKKKLFGDLDKTKTI